jgi:hypothetical protein
MMHLLVALVHVAESSSWTGGVAVACGRAAELPMPRSMTTRAPHLSSCYAQDTTQYVIIVAKTTAACSLDAAWKVDTAAPDALRKPRRRPSPRPKAQLPLARSAMLRCMLMALCKTPPLVPRMLPPLPVSSSPPPLPRPPVPGPMGMPQMLQALRKRSLKLSRTLPPPPHAPNMLRHRSLLLARMPLQPIMSGTQLLRCVGASSTSSSLSLAPSPPLVEPRTSLPTTPHRAPPLHHCLSRRSCHCCQRPEWHRGCVRRGHCGCMCWGRSPGMVPYALRHLPLHLAYPCIGLIASAIGLTRRGWALSPLVPSCPRVLLYASRFHRVGSIRTMGASPIVPSVAYTTTIRVITQPVPTEVSLAAATIASLRKNLKSETLI